jgi:hypothetical protein
LSSFATGNTGSDYPSKIDFECLTQIVAQPQRVRWQIRSPRYLTLRGYAIIWGKYYRRSFSSVFGYLNIFEYVRYYSLYLDFLGKIENTMIDVPKSLTDQYHF